jgi:hypothetical protein
MKTEGRTDRQMGVLKPTVAFHNFAHTSEIILYEGRVRNMISIQRRGKHYVKEAVRKQVVLPPYIFHNKGTYAHLHLVL